MSSELFIKKVKWVVLLSIHLITANIIISWFTLDFRIVQKKTYIFFPTMYLIILSLHCTEKFMASLDLANEIGRAHV